MRLTSRSRVRTTRAAPGTEPRPDDSEVSTVTRCPSRSRYLTRPAARRAADRGDGGVSWATSRTEHAGCVGGGAADTAHMVPWPAMPAAAGNGDVTAVVACFNYGRFLPEAVDSLLGQAGGPPRLIVVDDRSTAPGTLTELDRLPPEVDVIRQANQGGCAARNAGLARVETEYALVLDADDRLAAGALEAMRAPLEGRSELGFAYGYMRFFGDW